MAVPPPVAFYHREHVDYEQYPRGLQDVIGFWVEAKIFGGVLLFDRGETDADVSVKSLLYRGDAIARSDTKSGQCKEVFLHSGTLSGPVTIYPPTPEQFQKLVCFLEPEPGTAANPLPIRATKLNRPRWYRYHATKYFHIFRNKYDSRLPLRFPWPDRITGKNFPELDDRLWLMNHHFQAENNGVPLDKAAVAAAEESMRNITPSSPLWDHDGTYP